MRIHRLKLTHVKGVADREIHFPDEGIVVVEGENEAGKTTMIEALDLLFDEKDSSRKRHVMSMRPVGLDVASAVEVEASSGPYRFTYRKQWFRRPGTVLTVTAPKREDLTGSAAHDRARAILEETTDPDLWRALRLMQATPLGASDLSGSTALADALEEAAGQAVDSAGAEGDSLLAAVEETYREFFTATGRPTGEHRDAELRVDEARRVRDEAEAAVREVADDVSRHESAVRELTRLETQLAQGEALLDDLRAEWESTQEIVREAERLRVLTQLARQAFDAASERVAAREALVAEVAGLRDSAARAAEDHAALREELAPQEAAVRASSVLVDEARAAQRAARRKASRAESDAALLVDLQDLVAAADRIRRLDAAIDLRRRARETARATRFDVSLPDLEEAARALDLARAEWRAGSAAWRLVPQGEVIEIRVDGETRTLDAELTGVVGDTVEIVLPGVASVHLDPSAGAAARADVVAGLERALADLLVDAGVPDLAAAREAAAADAESRRDLTDAERAVDAVLAGDDPAEVRDRADRVRAHVVELLTARAREDGVDDADIAVLADAETVAVDDTLVAPIIRRIVAAASADDSPPADDGNGAGSPTAATRLRWAVTRARAAEDEAAEEIARWEAETATRRRALESARVAVARAEVAHASARSALEDAVRRLALARERHTDDELDTRAREAAAELAAATERQEQVGVEVRRHDPDSLRVRLDGAESGAVAIRRRFGEVRDERLAVEARLRHAGEQGRAERLIEAESALARAERAHASVSRRARAARTLFETLTRHRAEVTRTYVEPFGRAVSRLGRVVYGPDFEVEVGPSLAIEARVLGDRRIPYDALSSGAKEQMSILTRLACASLVDPAAGAPVILDDALGYSDPGRLQRICSAFSLVGGGAQVILLTCTPGRYAAIPDAHVIRL